MKRIILVLLLIIISSCPLYSQRYGMPVRHTPVQQYYRSYSEYLRQEQRRAASSNNNAVQEKTSNKKKSKNAKDSEESLGKIVDLVVTGEGWSKEDATQNALRTAIQQAYGVFVSANTTILNDDIVKDEIATLSSGNILSFQELAYNDEGGKSTITLSTRLSIGRLINYAQGHGATTEFAGQTFAMNMKMRDINRINEERALNNLLDELRILSKGMFLTSISASDPYKRQLELYGEEYCVEIAVYQYATEQSRAFYQKLMQIMSSLELSESEQNEYARSNDKYYKIKVLDDPGEVYYSSSQIVSKEISRTFTLRNDPKMFLNELESIIDDAIFGLSLKVDGADRIWTINNRLNAKYRGSNSIFQDRTHKNQIYIGDTWINSSFSIRDSKTGKEFETDSRMKKHVIPRGRFQNEIYISSRFSSSSDKKVDVMFFTVDIPIYQEELYSITGFSVLPSL